MNKVKQRSRLGCRVYMLLMGSYYGMFLSQLLKNGLSYLATIKNDMLLCRYIPIHPPKRPEKKLEYYEDLSSMVKHEKKLRGTENEQTPN